MPNIATALKAEIARIARKELKVEITHLRKQTARHRSEIAELKRRLDVSERQFSRGPRNTRAAPASSETHDGSGLRFRAAGLASHRQRLGLSAHDAGVLLGVSALTIYKWEKGEVKPRRTHMPRIAAFRNLGRRQALAILEQASAK